jgi:two-component system phosphate regulon sensor histidine kinase PhoR
MNPKLENADNEAVIAALKRAEKMRIDFVANVSHELRTPLTSIKGYTETLIEDLELGRPPDPEFLKIILKNSNRLLSLINDLLDLSAIESGADHLQPTLIDLKEFSGTVLDALKQSARMKETEITLEVKTPQLIADPKRTEQVMVNLVENAIKYCPVGSRIHICWEEKSSDGGTEILLRVSDNGPGIPEKHLDRLFERFYRIDKGRSRDMGGTGLGLSIVKHILQRHHGSIEVESDLGKGTTFICRFPNPRTLAKN